MGSGLIVVDATGTILGAKGIPSVAEDKEQAEAMAALEAVKMAKKKKNANHKPAVARRLS